MTWQWSPSIPGATGEIFKGSIHTTQVCLTQEMIDKYGALLPQSRGQCTMANELIKPGVVAADWVCTGIMSGKESLNPAGPIRIMPGARSTFTDTFQVGSDMELIEWTTESTATFNGEQCGSIKPPALPGSRRLTGTARDFTDMES